MEGGTRYPHPSPPGDFNFQALTPSDKSFITYLRDEEARIKKELQAYNPSVQSQVQDGFLQGRYYAINHAIEEYISGRY